MTGLIGVAEAIRILDAFEVHPTAVRRPLSRAAGLRLAADIVSDGDHPPFAKAVMDGYAVRIGRRDGRRNAGPRRQRSRPGRSAAGRSGPARRWRS